MKEFRDSMSEHFIPLGLVIVGLMYTLKFSKLNYKSLGMRIESRAFWVVEKDND